MRGSSITHILPPTDGLLPADILDIIGEAIQIVDVDWNCVYTNQAAADFGGTITHELQGKNIWEVFSDLPGSSLDEACHRAMREQVRVDLEYCFTRCAKWFEIHLHPTPKYLTLYATEITRRVEAEANIEHLAEIEALNARLQRTVEQVSAINEALLLSEVRQHQLRETAELLNARLSRAMQESHHRIKNNLQVISALVELQMSEARANSNNEYLERIQQHIHALASIHDLLTQQAKVNIETDYLGTKAMLDHLIPMLQQTSGGRRIEADIADVLLPVQQAASLSLLVSECVSNAVKHSKAGIEISLRAEGDKARLEICDDGNGFAPDFDWKAAANTGLFLIDSTARHDLRGEVRYDNHPGGGGRVAIVFPISNVA